MKKIQMKQMFNHAIMFVNLVKICPSPCCGQMFNFFLFYLHHLCNSLTCENPDFATNFDIIIDFAYIPWPDYRISS